MPIADFDLVIENEGKVTAIVAVNGYDHETGRLVWQSGARVAFRDGGRALPDRGSTAQNGETRVTLNLTPGRHTVEARLMSDPNETATATIDVPVPVRHSEGIWGLVAIIGFWALVLGLGVSTNTWRLTLAYGILIYLALDTIARRWRVDILAIARNNNWVFPAVVGMTILTGIVWYLNPYPGPTVVATLVTRWLPNWLIPKSLLVNYALGKGTFFGGINWLFFGEYATNGWKTATGFYGVAALVAIGISYLDETIARVRRAFAGEHRTLTGELGEHVVMDFLYDHLFSPFLGKGKK